MSNANRVRVNVITSIPNVVLADTSSPNVVVAETSTPNIILADELNSGTVIQLITRGPQGIPGPIGPPGVAGTHQLVDLTDVDADSTVDGSILIYESASQKFVAGPDETKSSLVDGGNF